MLSSIKDVHKLVRKRELSVTELCNRALRRIDETRRLNAFITTRNTDDLLKEAKLLDETRKDDLHPLFGVPISLKDNFCTSNMPTTCGSKMLHNFVPPYDATVVRKLKQANCLIMGKTNMDEFAMGSSCTTSYYKPAANSWKSEHLLESESNNLDQTTNWFIAGGSSTGSAVSVATGACFGSIGTDTGGSTRQPASLTGTVGFKPTYGLISRHGLVPLAHCLDVVSLLARNVDDIELLFNTVVGQDTNDLTSVDHTKELKQNLNTIERPIRIGIPKEFIATGELAEDVSERFNEIVKLLSNNYEGGDSKLRIEVVNVQLPHASLATECYTVISSAEISSNMSCYDGVKYGFSVQTDQDDKSKAFDRDAFFKTNRDLGFGSEVKKRILLGNYFLLEENREKYLVQALKLRRLISEDFSKVFGADQVDALLMPSTPTTSIDYSEWLKKQDCNKLFREDYYLIPANLANVPSISLPCGLSKKGLPIGIQLVGNRFHDLDLLQISKFLEKEVFAKFKQN